MGVHGFQPCRFAAKMKPALAAEVPRPPGAKAQFQNDSLRHRCKPCPPIRGKLCLARIKFEDTQTRKAPPFDGASRGRGRPRHTS